MHLTVSKCHNASGAQSLELRESTAPLKAAAPTVAFPIKQYAEVCHSMFNRHTAKLGDPTSPHRSVSIDQRQTNAVQG